MSCGRGYGRISREEGKASQWQLISLEILIVVSAFACGQAREGKAGDGGRRGKMGFRLSR